MKFIALATLAILGILSPLGTSTVFAGNAPGTVHCPPKTTPFLDSETGVWLCEHPTVQLANGHPAYDERAACTPGETRQFRVPLKNGGFRIVRQVCTDNYTGPAGNHSSNKVHVGGGF